jgi:hypothetical protein
MLRWDPVNKEASRESKAQLLRQIDAGEKLPEAIKTFKRAILSQDSELVGASARQRDGQRGGRFKDDAPCEP